MQKLQPEGSIETPAKHPGEWLYLFGRSGLYGVLTQLFGNRFLRFAEPHVRFRHAAIVASASALVYYGAINAVGDFKHDISSPSRCSQVRSAAFPSTVPMRAPSTREKCLAGGLPPNGYLAPADTIFVSRSDAWGYQWRRGVRTLSGFALLLSLALASLLWRREETKETYKAVFGEDSDEYKRVAKLEIPVWKRSDEVDDWLINPPAQSGIDSEATRSSRPVFGRKAV